MSISGARRGAISGSDRNVVGVSPERPPTPPDEKLLPESSSMPTWSAAASNASTAPVRILCFGDSTTEGEGSALLAERWQEKLAVKLRAQFPASSVTYSPNNYYPIKFVSPSIAAENKWVIGGAPSFPNNFGLGTRVAILNAVDETAALTFTGTRAVLSYTGTPTASTWRWRVDAGAWTDVVTSGTQTGGVNVDTGVRSAGSHVVDVAWVSGGDLYLGGAFVYHGEFSKGIQVFDGGHHGLRSGTVFGGSATQWQQEVATVNPHLVLLNYGINDYGGNHLPADYKTNMLAIISRIKAAASGAVPSILLMAPYARGGTFTHPWSQYVTALKEIDAADTDVSLIDLGAQMPPVSDTASGLYASDKVHLTPLGNTRYAELLFDYLVAAIVDGGGVVNDGGTSDPSLVYRRDLPFDVPTRATLAASPFKVWAHYFTPFPITLQGDWTKDVDNRLNPDTGKSIDTTDYIDHRWLPLGSIEGGTDNRLFGGLMRDAHILRRAKRVSVASSTLSGLTLTWQIQDKMHEVRDAIKAGLDGFTLDVLQVPQTTTMPGRYDYAAMPGEWRKSMWLCEAVGEVNRQDRTDFRVTMMPDGTTSATKSSTNLARAMLHVAKTYPNVCYFRDGRFVLAPFQAEGGAGGINLSGMTPFDFWSDVLRRIRGAGVATYFWPCYQKDYTVWHPKLTSLAYGASIWGDRDRVRVTAEGNRARRAYHYLRNNFSTTQKWMHYVAPGDQRPREGNWWEQDHAATLDGSWEAAIGDTTALDANGDLLHRKSDMVQVVTWSDFPESAHICPSRLHGYGLVSLNWWWLIKFKTGKFPTILRDELYLSHRIQPTASEPNTSVNYTGGFQTKFYDVDPLGGTGAQNTVGVIAFLKTSAQVIINVGGVDHDKGTLAAGRHTLRAPLVPIGTGNVSARIVRGGVTVFTVNGRQRVSTSQPVQDYQYRFSRRLPNPA